VVNVRFFTEIQGRGRLYLLGEDPSLHRAEGLESPTFYKKLKRGSSLDMHQLTMAFSKLTEPYDQDVADMMFIDPNAGYASDADFTNELDMHPNLYYIDGELIAVYKDRIDTVRMVEESVFNYLIKLMRREYEWYYDEEYTRVMDHIRATGGNKDKVLRIIYDEIDYPTLRDSKCPHHCEGCQIKRVCRFCSGFVSHCVAIENDGDDGTTYYCNDDCFTAFWRQEYTPRLHSFIEIVTDHLSNSVRKVHLIDTALKQKGKLLHFKNMLIQGKSSMLRTELELVRQAQICTSTVYMTEKYIYEVFLKRDKTRFLTHFTTLQELYDEQMQLSPTSEDIVECASVSKQKVEQFHRFAHVFLGIQEE